MILVALALLFEFACAHEAARVKVDPWTNSLHASDQQLETTETEAVSDAHHRASHAHLAEEVLSAIAVPLRNGKPANKEPWQFDIRFACMFANASGGFDYFYKLLNDLFLRNCFCSSDGSRGFNIVFEDTTLGEVLTSPDERASSATHERMGVVFGPNTVTKASSRSTTSCLKPSASSPRFNQERTVFY